MSAETPPWADVPTCPKCNRAGLLAHIPPEDDVCTDAGAGSYPSEELAALNDCDEQRWLWCTRCEETIDAGPVAFKRAERADEWWNRDDREAAWEDMQRQAKVDAVAAEHAKRQLPLFGGGS